MHILLVVIDNSPLIVFLIYCDCYCSVAVPHDTMGWSAVFDCVISWSYSLFDFVFLQEDVHNLLDVMATFYLHNYI